VIDTAIPCCCFFLQVLMQLAQAFLSCSQPKRVLDCISIMQGLSTGRTPPAGLLQLSSLALLQQGKLAAASAQLCAWLKQGGQSTAEACAAVRSFLLALNSCGLDSAATNAQERAAAVQAVAAAAGELCRSDPAVALEVVMQLLSEEVSWRKAVLPVCLHRHATATAMPQTFAALPDRTPFMLTIFYFKCHDGCCVCLWRHVVARRAAAVPS
jgi:hypothetical protein